MHLGTLAAVCVVFWKDVKNLVIHGFSLIVDACVYAWQWLMSKIRHEDFSRRRLINNAYRKFALLIIVTSIPTAIIGFALKGVINAASSILVIPGICLVVTAIVLLLVDGHPGGKRKRRQQHTKMQQSSVLPRVLRHFREFHAQALQSQHACF